MGVYQNTALSELLLTNYNNNIVGDIRMDTGFIRLSNGGELGTNNGVSALRGLGGVWDIRTDAPTSFSGHGITDIDGSMAFFVDTMSAVVDSLADSEILR